MKLSITAFSLLVAVSALGYFIWNKYKAAIKKPNYSIPIKHIDDSKEELFHVRENAAAIKSYLLKNHFNTDYCFLIDMKIPSGKKRFFVFNLKKDSIEKAGLVAHGLGSEKGDSLVFSNVPESKCTSLGKYKIGKPYNGTYGLAYKLYGLDKTNSNALKRFVVLHSYKFVPEEEVYPSAICESYGCAMVAPGFLNTLKPYLEKAQRPIILWIFY
jgi:hypothetical protein